MTACAETQGSGSAPGEVIYLGIETRLLEQDLVNLRGTVRGALTEEDAIRYAECAAAQYALIRGFGFARQIRTTVETQGDIIRADAVYVISASLPDGIAKLDAEVVVADCKENGIPTV
ncbi:MAG: hypothetical protein AAGF53_07780 [Pseudomonadota bacterium]